jgi:hypothetical protein
LKPVELGVCQSGKRREIAADEPIFDLQMRLRGKVLAKVQNGATTGLLVSVSSTKFCLRNEE